MNFITEATVEAVKHLYNTEITAADINLQETRKEFEGQLTIVTFPFTRFSKKSPEQTGTDIGAFLQNELPDVSGFNVIKGFLNISLADSYWINQLYTEISSDKFAVSEPNGKKVMVEYSSPNTNKPLHLGHVRNNLLGFSVAEILAAAGYEVIKANLVNDRGIHICKSMLAWQKFGHGETPESSGMKGDHLVGKYYVAFETALRAQLLPILDGIYKQNDLAIFSEKQQLKIKQSLDAIVRLEEKIKNPGAAKIEDLKDKIGAEKDNIIETAKGRTALMLEAQEMLLKWEAGDEAVIDLWKTMNKWVYTGFAETYRKMGVTFDKFYYESDTYLLGKDIIEEGLEKGVFFKKDDGSVWIDLTAEGLDEKLVLRSDGTSVYITQDMGTAQLKYNDFHMDKSIYVVGNEQDYHFKVLFLILQKLGKAGADGLFHLSYGMVDLPSGKMKSREGTVVDADDLMEGMEEAAKQQALEIGKMDSFSETEKEHLYRLIGMGALKYFLLKVDPKKRILFNPEESIELQGHTGPFIQYTHARIKSVLSKAGFKNGTAGNYNALEPAERDIIVLLTQFPEIIKTAAETYSPAIVANYVYELAKTYNKFYQDTPILKVDDENVKQFRLQLSSATAKAINKAMKLLGIEVPERM